MVALAMAVCVSGGQPPPPKYQMFALGR
jgi:hypothetical protein